MTLRIKQRQLRNLERLKPKTDIAINGIDNGTSVYRNGTQVIDSISGANTDYYSYISCGNGEYLVIQFLNNATFLIKYKRTPIENTGQLLLTPSGINLTTDKKYITYLGRRNGIRYAITTYYDTNWKIALINLEDMTIERLWNGNPDLFYDFTYDGIDTIYLIYKELKRVYYLNLSDTLTQVQAVDDDSGAAVLSERIYGMVDDYIIYKDLNDNLIKNYQISTKIILGTTQPSTNMVLLANGISILSFENGAVYYFSNPLNAAGSVELTQFLVATGIINQGETGLYPLAITNYKEDNGVITLNWILWRDTPSIKSFETIEVVITNGSISEGMRYPNLILSPEAEFMINNTNNVTQSYNIGKWNNYGLQFKWDNR